TDPALRAALERVDEVPRPEVASLPRHALRFVWWRAAALVRGRPFWASDLRLGAYRRRLAEVVASFRPDVVQVEYAAMAQYVPPVSGSAPCVLVEHDPEAGGAAGAGALGRRLDARAWRRLRRRALEAVDAAVVFTERDRELLAPVAASTPVETIPFGADSLDGAAG